MPGPEGTSDPSIARALQLSDAGDHTGALALADQVVALEPDRADAHIARGWALENMGPANLERARDAYERAVRLDPEALWAKEGLANVLRRLGHADAADTLAADVVAAARAIPERDAEVLELQGWCEFQLGRLPEAEATFRSALDGDPDLVSVRLDLALVLLCAGRTQEALAAYDEGLATASRLGDRTGVVAIALDDLEDAVEARGRVRAADQARERLGRFVPDVPRRPGPATSRGA